MKKKLKKALRAIIEFYGIEILPPTGRWVKVDDNLKIVEK